MGSKGKISFSEQCEKSKKAVEKNSEDVTLIATPEYIAALKAKIAAKGDISAFKQY